MSEKNSNVFQSVELVDFAVAEKRTDIHVLLVDHKEFIGNEITDGIVIDTKGI